MTLSTHPFVLVSLPFYTASPQCVRKPKNLLPIKIFHGSTLVSFMLFICIFQLLTGNSSKGNTLPCRPIWPDQSFQTTVGSTTAGASPSALFCNWTLLSLRDRSSAMALGLAAFPKADLQCAGVQNVQHTFLKLQEVCLIKLHHHDSPNRWYYLLDCFKINF